MDIGQELTRLVKLLEEISRDLEGHMRVKEREFLPILAKRATDIVRRKVLYEHQTILKSISDLTEHVKGCLVGESADRKGIMGMQARGRDGLKGLLEQM